jgi:hypothetical protein
LEPTTGKPVIERLDQLDQPARVGRTEVFGGAKGDESPDLDERGVGSIVALRRSRSLLVRAVDRSVGFSDSGRVGSSALNSR